VSDLGMTDGGARASLATVALTAICVTAFHLVAAAQTPTCTTARITPASIRVGPGAQTFTFDIAGEQRCGVVDD
jgi:hypothetical protein